MAQSLTIDNFDRENIVGTTQLNDNLAVNSSSATVRNTQGIISGAALIIGRLGGEGSELLTAGTITAPSTVALSSNNKLAHSRFDDLTVLFGTKIRVYRAANVDGTQPADDDFSLIATIDIGFDQVMTDYADATGSEAYWYKFTYYNSGDAVETRLSDSTAARGGTDNNYCSIEDIKEEAGIKSNRWVTDAQIDERRQAAQQEVNGILNGLYDVPFLPPINPFIVSITKRLAAGLLLTSPLAGQFTGTNSEGSAKLEAARKDLQALKDKTTVLTDNSGTPISNPGVGGVSMWPNQSTATASPEVGGAPRKIRMSDRY